LRAEREARCDRRSLQGTAERWAEGAGASQYPPAAVYDVRPLRAQCAAVGPRRSTVLQHRLHAWQAVFRSARDL